MIWEVNKVVYITANEKKKNLNILSIYLVNYFMYRAT